MGPSTVLFCRDVDLEGFGSDYVYHPQVNRALLIDHSQLLTCNGNICFCRNILALVCTAAKTLS